MFKSTYPRRTFLQASGISLSACVLLGSNSAVPLRRIENGFVASAGVAKDGWYAGILVLDDRESEFCKDLADPGRWACAVTGNGFEAEFKKAAQWRAAIKDSPRRLVFHSERVPAEGRMLTAAERICGPAAARGTTAKPALAWTERRGGRWTLRSFDGGRVSSAYSAAGMLRNPAVAMTARGLVLACECEGKNGPEIRLISEQGSVATVVAGVNPRLAAGENTIFLLFERAGRDTISVVLLEFDGSRIVREVEVPRLDDYTKNADLLYDATDGSVLVPAESCPAFGISEQLGTYRAVHIWRLPPGKSTFVPYPTEGRNQSPVPPDSVPLFPRIFRIAGAPAVAYRIYRYSEMKGTYGWDVWISCLENGEWSPARMVTSNYGAADTGFDILDVRGKQIGVFPCRDHFPGGHISRSYWTEIVDLNAKSRPDVRPAPAVPNVKPASGLRAIALEPPELPSRPEGLELIWGDLHHHTAYSTCQAPTNGMPQDHLRFSRDVLGCQILTLTEHGHHMIEPESTYVQDRVEEFAGQKGIVLYADEPNPEPGRHTIFYTIDRQIFDRLRTIFLSHGRSRPAVYRHIHRALPPGSVIAITHFHGHPLRGDAMRRAFDPELDVAMESMQIRGNVMMQLHRESEGLLFPNDCLDLGLKVGLVAGTDHTFAADVRRNHYCLTGLWVRERTPEGVFEALRARRTVGMSDGKIAVWATLAGQRMGSEVECSGKVSVHAELSCARRIVRAALMRDGKIQNWTPIGDKRASLELVDPEPAPGYHWYVVTVEMATAYGTPGYCHASPFFVTARA